MYVSFCALLQNGCLPGKEQLHNSNKIMAIGHTTKITKVVSISFSALVQETAALKVMSKAESHVSQTDLTKRFYFSGNDEDKPYIYI